MSAPSMESRKAVVCIPSARISRFRDGQIVELRSFVIKIEVKYEASIGS